MLITIHVNEQSMMVDDHCVNHIVHFLMFVEPWHMGDVVIGLINLEKNKLMSLILWLWDMHTKCSLLFNSEPSNFIAYDSLMQDAMKIALSYIALLFQFHTKMSYIIMSSYFKRGMLFKVQLGSNCFVKMQALIMDLTWAWKALDGRDHWCC